MSSKHPNSQPKKQNNCFTFINRIPGLPSYPGSCTSRPYVSSRRCNHLSDLILGICSSSAVPGIPFFSNSVNGIQGCDWRDMAITHADLESGRRCGFLGGKAGSVVVILCVFAGLLGFICCLLSELTRSEAIWILVPKEGGKEEFRCSYNRDGRVALLCGIGAAMILALVMLVLHAYMWLAFKNETPLQLFFDGSSIAASKKVSTVFLATWVCFGVAEVLLVMGIVVEAVHLVRWQQPRHRCLVMRPWLFLSAGIFVLLSVLSATINHVMITEAISARNDHVEVAREAIEAHNTFSLVTQPSNSQPLPDSSLDAADDGVQESETKITS